MMDTVSRRDFIKFGALVVLGASSVVLSGCKLEPGFSRRLAVKDGSDVVSDRLKGYSKIVTNGD